MSNEVSKHLVKLGIEGWSFKSSVIHISSILLVLQKFWEHFMKKKKKISLIFLKL